MTKAQKNMLDHGIKMPIRTNRAAAHAGIPLYVACAFLMQETNGGANVYGHDVDSNGYPRPFWGHGLVTPENYKAYLIERDLGILNPGRFPRLGRRSQGVGPMQLTFFAFQDAADKAGGCWDPEVNMTVAFKIIHNAMRTGKTLHEVAKEYNGKESYAVQMDVKFNTWRRIMGGM